MNLTQDKVIGIVGGMGPQAGVALLNNVLTHTEAREDQQHLSAILMSFPKYIVDRTSFLEGDQVINPAYNIAGIITRLENAGAKIIGIACNTSHSPDIHDVILEELAKRNSQVKLLHMPVEACNFIRDNYGNVKRIGLMATNGTYRSGVYEELIKNMGYEFVIPEPEFQNEVIHKLIYDKNFGIKANPGKTTREALELLNKATHFFKSQKTDAIILGCTELSLILTEKVVSDMIVVDSTVTLAKALIREATMSEEKEILLAMTERF